MCRGGCAGGIDFFGQDRKTEVIVALDVPTIEKAKELIEKIVPYNSWFKIGLEAIMAGWAKEAAQLIKEKGGNVFIDGKFDDIPNTIGNASKAAVANFGADMLNVHANAGSAAMAAAVRNAGNCLVLAVTVLTSLNDSDSEHIFGAAVKEKVLDFVKDAKAAGVHGIICSPQELTLSLEHPEEFKGLLLVTPGVRPEWAAAGDQKRVMTPGEAAKMGADFLVIGRPITAPPKIGDKETTPAEAIKNILAEIAEAR